MTRRSDGTVQYWIRSIALRGGRVVSGRRVGATHHLVRGNCSERWIEYLASELRDDAGDLIQLQRPEGGARTYVQPSGPATEALKTACTLT